MGWGEGPRRRPMTVTSASQGNAGIRQACLAWSLGQGWSSSGGAPGIQGAYVQQQLHRSLLPPGAGL